MIIILPDERLGTSNENLTFQKACPAAAQQYSLLYAVPKRRVGAAGGGRGGEGCRGNSFFAPPSDRFSVIHVNVNPTKLTDETEFSFSSFQGRRPLSCLFDQPALKEVLESEGKEGGREGGCLRELERVALTACLELIMFY